MSPYNYHITANPFVCRNHSNIWLYNSFLPPFIHLFAQTLMAMGMDVWPACYSIPAVPRPSHNTARQMLMVLLSRRWVPHDQPAWVHPLYPGVKYYPPKWRRHCHTFQLAYSQTTALGKLSTAHASSSSSFRPIMIDVMARNWCAS